VISENPLPFVQNPAGYQKNVAGFTQNPPRFGCPTLHFFTFSLFTFHFSLLSGASGVSKIIPARTRAKKLSRVANLLSTHLS